MLHLLRSCNLMLPTYGDNFFICFFFFFSHFSKGLQRQEVELQLQHGTRVGSGDNDETLERYQLLDQRY